MFFVHDDQNQSTYDYKNGSMDSFEPFAKHFGDTFEDVYRIGRQVSAPFYDPFNLANTRVSGEEENVRKVEKRQIEKEIRE